MNLKAEEPAAGPWRIITAAEFVRILIDPLPRPDDRPRILAVDGRGGSGKSTVADLLERSVKAAAVIHTDDVAWHHSFFDWSDLLIEGLLEPLRRGEAVSYTPPGWVKKGRPGAIEVSSGLDLVIVEGVGASRSELVPYIDGSVWVQSDYDEAERRGIIRDGGTQEAADFWHEWQAEEVDFIRREQPWTRAAVVVNGTPELVHDPASELVISANWPRTGGETAPY